MESAAHGESDPLNSFPWSPTQLIQLKSQESLDITSWRESRRYTFRWASVAPWKQSDFVSKVEGEMQIGWLNSHDPLLGDLRLVKVDMAVSN